MAFLQILENMHWKCHYCLIYQILLYVRHPLDSFVVLFACFALLHHSKRHKTLKSHWIEQRTDWTIANISLIVLSKYVCQFFDQADDSDERRPRSYTNSKNFYETWNLKGKVARVQILKFRWIWSGMNSKPNLLNRILAAKQIKISFNHVEYLAAIFPRYFFISSKA